MIIIRIVGTQILFTTGNNLSNFSTIDGLRLSEAGILKEHPDLKGLSKVEMRIEAIKRFKKHIKKLGSEIKIKKYIVKELRPHGYELQLIKRKGFRPERVK